MSFWVLAFTLSTVLAAAGFVAVAILWLRKLRETLAEALNEIAARQASATRQLNEAITGIQRKQRFYEQNLRTLAETDLSLRQEINLMAGKIEVAEHAERNPAATSRRIH